MANDAPTAGEAQAGALEIQDIPLTDVVSNPWRDLDLNPLDEEHVSALCESIKNHGFIASMKGRHRNGKFEIASGHMLVAAARKAGLDAIPIFIDDTMDDDAMLLVMVVENATKAGSRPGVLLNEVAAVIRRLIAGLTSPIVPEPVRKAFEDKHERALAKLRNGTDVLSRHVIMRYLGDGNPRHSHRGEREIRDAITTLKMSGIYDEIVAPRPARGATMIPAGRSPSPSHGTA